jgi:hypothetical protein
MTRNLWCHIQHWAYNNYYYYIFPAFFHLPKISSYLKKNCFFIQYLSIIFSIYQNFIRTSELLLVVTANGLLPYKQFLLLVQIKPVCEKLSFWITNNAMGSASINPKIRWSEGSFCEHYFLQPLVDHFVSNKSIIQDLIQKIQTWDWKTMIEIQNV